MFKLGNDNEADGVAGFSDCEDAGRGLNLTAAAAAAAA
jgi:hypothetical protein